MLNLHLKRMCARVIASLSALGVVSIAGSFDAEATVANYSSSTTYKYGDKFNYSVTKALTLTAQYNEKAGSCPAAPTQGVSTVGTYSGNSTNTSATCIYKCDKGKLFNSNGSPSSPAWASGFVIWGDPGSTMGVGTGECVWPTPTCATVANATSSISNVVADGPYMCTWTCKAGYKAVGNNIQGNGFTGVATELTVGNLTQTTTGTCTPSTYTVTFDCTTSGKISGTSQQTGTATATYGAAFEIKQTCTPNTSAWTFTGWKGN